MGVTYEALSWEPSRYTYSISNVASLRFPHKSVHYCILVILAIVTVYFLLQQQGTFRTLSEGNNLTNNSLVPVNSIRVDEGNRYRKWCNPGYIDRLHICPVQLTKSTSYTVASLGGIARVTPSRVWHPNEKSGWIYKEHWTTRCRKMGVVKLWRDDS